MIHNLIIFDKEEAYVRSFANYVNMQKSFPFEVRYFYERGKMLEFSAKNDIDIILVSEDLMEDVSDADCHLLIKLNDDKVGNVSNDGSIYKYQSCEQIIKQILAQVAESPEIKNLTFRKNEMKIIGLYSPIKVAGQTQLAIAIGKILSSDFRVLYINLEGYSGLDEILDIKFSIDLSDLMYDIKNGKKDVSASIGGNVQNLNGLDIFPIMRDFRDLEGMSFSEWKGLLRKIETDTDYDYVILDISDHVQGKCELLSICNNIFMVERDDRVAKAKKKHFLENLAAECKGDILDKTKGCKLNFMGNSDNIYDTNSLFCDYAKQLLEETELI